MMKITMLYAGVLALWYLVLSVHVIRGRVGRGNPSLGDGGNAAMLRRIRGHANFAEYVPLILLMMALLESAGASSAGVHAIGGILLLGRLLHGYALSFTPRFMFGRSAGTALTFIAMLAAALQCLYFASIQN